MVYSVLRRYTPPTCTLEILAKSSPLSRWAGQPVLKNLRFQLSLDDPKLPQEKWVKVQGDRSQLEALCQAVQTYVQNLLEQSHLYLNEAFLPAQLGRSAVALAETATTDLHTQAAIEPFAGIALQPQGILAHDLSLGSLATPESGEVVNLSTLQLFDLANALDDYSTEVLTLPTLSQASWLKPSRPWGQVAAAAVLLIAVSASIVRVLDSSTTTQQTAATSSAGASSSDQRIATQLPPNTTESTVPPTSALPGRAVPPPPPPGSLVPGNPTLQKVPINPTAPTNADGAEGNETEPAVTGSNEAQSQAGTGKQTMTLDEPTVVGKAETTGKQNAAPQVEIANSPKRDNVVASPDPKPDRSSTTTTALKHTPPQTAAAAESAPSAAAANPAFDPIPQVAEVKAYFQQRWKVPEGLTQTLEYQLVLNANGTIQGIVPLGEAAGNYVDRSGIPLPGESFVSPLKDITSAKIRLVLNPDGTVQAFEMRD